MAVSMLAGCRVGIGQTGGAGSWKRDLYIDSVKKTLIRIVSCNTLNIEMSFFEARTVKRCYSHDVAGNKGAEGSRLLSVSFTGV